jgi:hypothetical protein
MDGMLSELEHIAASWEDDTSKRVVALVHTAVAIIRAKKDAPLLGTIEDLIRKDPEYLDALRLFIGESQDVIAHRLGAELGARGSYAKVRKALAADPKAGAKALEALGLLDIIREHLGRSWSVEGVLVDRYKQSRGRAIAGQARGRVLEDAVAEVLTRIGVQFQMRCTFTGKNDITAKCDFAIPSEAQPKIVIEVKGFEATGSKQTDVLGDIEKIELARTRHMYFFVVTDGRGWFNRESDLRKIVEKQRSGAIDNVYTRKRLAELATHVRQIMTTEMKAR